MQCKDIVAHLMDRLPRNSDRYSEYSVPETVTVSGSTVSVQMNSHGLRDNQPVSITHSMIENSIDSFEVIGSNVKLTCSEVHYLSHGWKGNTTVRIISTSDSSINGYYNVSSVDSGKTLTVSNMVLSPPSDMTLLENIDYGINGIYDVTVIDDNRFEYTIDFGETIDSDFTLDVYTPSVRISNKIRITGSNDIKRYLKAYEKPRDGKIWLCVVLGDFDISKGLDTMSDANNEQGVAANWDVPMIEHFSVHAIIPCSNETGRDARDLAEKIRIELFRALLGASFEGDLSSQLISTVTPEGDGEHTYNVAYYSHEFRFAQVSRITNEDTSMPGRTTPLREIDIAILGDDINNDNVLISISTELED